MSSSTAKEEMLLFLDVSSVAEAGSRGIWEARGRDHGHHSPRKKGKRSFSRGKNKDVRATIYGDIELDYGKQRMFVGELLVAHCEPKTMELSFQVNARKDATPTVKIFLDLRRETQHRIHDRITKWGL